MDCLLGNWDAVYNASNLLMSTDGRAMRIDTGNSLLFRSQGGRKPDGTFGDVVREVEFGDNDELLGEGMRQKYPDLTDEEITRQVTEMRDKLTDNKIEELVNNVRLPLEDRTQIINTLKARRDYLVDRFGVA